MINTRSKILYSTFGMKVLTEIPLPELTPVNQKEEIGDIIIQIDDLSQQWHEFGAPQNKFIVKENLVMFQVPDTATFLVQDGKKITVSPSLGVEEDKIRLYILGTCMGAILMQRKVLPLHGSAIAINGKAYAFVGNSGAGKSTLASAFLSRGYQLLSDDVIAVSLEEHNKPYVLPSYPQQKLWQESLHEFGMETENYQPLFERETKYAVPVTSQFYANPLPLAGVIELVKSESEQIELFRIEKLESIRTLFFHTFRHSFIQRLGLTQWHFKLSVNILNEIEVYQIKRPTSRFTAHDMVSLILESLTKEEK